MSTLSSAEAPALTHGSHPYALYGALLIAWVATLGSLYFSEIRNFVPCTLCWYQRILMYPLALLLVIGILLRMERLALQVLPFSLLGQGVAAYHYLLQKTTLFGGAAVCTGGSPCTTMWINWFGFITIPFLAMVAFSLLTVAALVAHYGQIPAAAWPTTRIAAVGTIVGITLLFYGGAQLQTPSESAQAYTFQTLETEGAPLQSYVVSDEDPAAWSEGRTRYQQLCSPCHGEDAQGIAGLGSSLVDLDLLREDSTAVFASVVREGRSQDHPDNQSGIAMPAFPESPSFGDGQLESIISYLRSLPMP